jgi:hypothetical protein
MRWRVFCRFSSSIETGMHGAGHLLVARRLYCSAKTQYVLHSCTLRFSSERFTYRSSESLFCAIFGLGMPSNRDLALAARWIRSNNSLYVWTSCVWALYIIWSVPGRRLLHSSPLDPV